MLFSRRRSFLCLFLLSAIVLLALGACNKSTPDTSGTPNTEDTGEPAKAEILADDLNKYTIVIPETADIREIDAANLLKKAFAEKYGVDLTVKNDFETESDANNTEYEILVGQTNRAQSKAFVRGLRTRDYGYTIANKKIVIAGTNGLNTQKAAKRFIDDIVNRQAVDVFMRQADEFYYRSLYSYQSVKINGAEMWEYAISYKEDADGFSQDLAKQLRDYIAAQYEYWLELKVEDNAGNGKEIRIGAQSSNDALPIPSPLAADAYYVGMHQENLYLYGGGNGGLAWAVFSFFDMLGERAVINDKTALLNFDEGEILKGTCEVNPVMTAMSFNVYTQFDMARAERLITLVNNYMPDVVGFQEASPKWMNQLNEALKPLYGSVGKGRDSGNTGEFNPIFYRKDKFTLISSGTKWLSDTPDRVSKYLESSLNRIMTYAVLKRHSDGAMFLYVNTHLEHTSGAARVKQTQALMKIIRELPDYPIVLTGDFNCTPGTAEYNNVASEMANASEIALSRENAGATFHAYGGANSVIDFIFVSQDKFEVELYKVVTDKIDGEYTSDHHPVFIRYTLRP